MTKNNNISIIWILFIILCIVALWIGNGVLLMLLLACSILWMANFIKYKTDKIWDTVSYFLISFYFMFIFYLMTGFFLFTIIALVIFCYQILKLFIHN